MTRSADEEFVIHDRTSDPKIFPLSSFFNENMEENKERQENFEGLEDKNRSFYIFKAVPN